MIAAPGAASVGEDQNAFLIIHEGLRLGEVGRPGSIFDSEAVDATGTGFANDTARAPGHFRHDVGAEALDDLVESPGNRRQRGERLDQAVTRSEEHTSELQSLMRISY